MAIESNSSAPIDVRELSFNYGRKNVFENVSFQVPEGALYALLGPNGSGKTTLMQVLIGVLRNYRGNAAVRGRECAELRPEHRQQLGYVAEGLKLPGWMRLEQLEAYLEPLYPTWDRAHATSLRERFELDATAKIRLMSRGQYMKAALLCALAPRPRLLLLDEPFTGMDVSVKDDLVQGLLAASSGEGCTIMLSSHDIGELELLADWVGFLGEHSMKLSESMESLRARFKTVDVVLDSDARVNGLPDTWLSVEQSGAHIRFVVPNAAPVFEQQLRAERFPSAKRVEVRDATLKEIFLALQRSSKKPDDRARAIL